MKRVNKHDKDLDHKQDPTYGGVHYRWRYDEYKRTLEEKRKRADKRAGIRFGLAIAIIGAICLVIFVTALLYSFSKDENEAPDGNGADYVVQNALTEE